MAESLRFERFEIRPDQRLLLVDGRPVDIGARAFDVLMTLVERRDRVVSKHEILDVVWPGRFVEENNLAVHVSTLRRELEPPQAIATIPGQGYRFVATPVEPPVSPPALVGRASELAALEELLLPGACVTVVGAGGIGKTALARAAVRVCGPRSADGAVWVDLTEVTDEARLPAAIAQAVEQRWRVEGRAGARGIDLTDGVDPSLILRQALKPLALLLVLDNAEHLIEPVARTAQSLRAAAPGLQLLVTSQVPLRIDGEQVFRLGPLALPPETVAPAEATRYGAVAFFVERVRAADRTFQVTDDNVGAVVRLCHALDGAPLALKLAAARVPVLGLQGVVQRLGNHLGMLGHGDRGAPARQRTLLAALEWSHGLLDPPLQAVFRRLAVFAGGFPLELVARVAGDPGFDETASIDALSELVDRSLVGVEYGSCMRYRLAETVRAYARLQLEAAGESAPIQRRHAEAVADAMESAYLEYWASADAQWLERQAPELDNVRVALDWAAAEQPALGIGLIASAGVLFMLLGQAPEARRRFAALEPAAHEAGVTPRSARYWLERSRLQWGVDNDAMLAFARRAVDMHRALADRRGLALSLRCAISSVRMPLDQAEAAMAEMAALEPPDASARMKAQRLLAETNLLLATGRPTEAAAVGDALLALATRAGLDGMAAAALAGLASARLAAGDADGAVECAERLLRDPRARRGNFLLHPLGTMARAHLLRGDVARARKALSEFVAVSQTRGWEWLGLYAGAFAWLAACEGRPADAARLLGYADRSEACGGTSEAARDRERARLALAGQLDESTLQRLAAEGRALDEPAVCAVGLAVRD